MNKQVLHSGEINELSSNGKYIDFNINRDSKERTKQLQCIISQPDLEVAEGCASSFSAVDAYVSDNITNNLRGKMDDMALILGEIIIQLYSNAYGDEMYKSLVEELIELENSSSV